MANRSAHLTAILLLAAAPLATQLAAQLGSPLGAARESLLIGPGDALHLQVYDTPELEQHLKVDDAGYATLLFLGRVPLAGDTPADAARTIAELMVQKDLMRHPQVTLTIDQYATQEVSVTGEVGHPGSFTIATPRSILDVLGMAGGLSPMGDRHIVIRHHDPAALPTHYFVSNDPARSLATDITIRPGDTILVPRIGLIYVLGDVARPGGFPMSTSDTPVTVLQALAVAGSPNKTASLGSARLLRKTGEGYREIPLNLGDIQKAKRPDLTLEADDVLVVPFNYGKNFVLNGTSIAAAVVSSTLYVR